MGLRANWVQLGLHANSVFVTPEAQKSFGHFGVLAEIAVHHAMGLE
jgi:hypothetical protein